MAAGSSGKALYRKRTRARLRSLHAPRTANATIISMMTSRIHGKAGEEGTLIGSGVVPKSARKYMIRLLC